MLKLLLDIEGKDMLFGRALHAETLGFLPLLFIEW